MTLIEQLADEQTWNEFFSYKQQLGHLSQQHEKELQQFIGEKVYLEVLDRIRTKGFPLPQKRLISKVNSDKKRVVYTYPTAENYLLKLLTYLLIRRYDRLFAPNLYSFRVRHGVKRAIHGMSTRPIFTTTSIRSMWSCCCPDCNGSWPTRRSASI